MSASSHEKGADIEKTQYEDQHGFKVEHLSAPTADVKKVVTVYNGIRVFFSSCPALSDR
jgi:hypothetical protein